MAPEKQLNNDIYVVSSCIIDIYDQKNWNLSLKQS
jgi:hypothetical protein